jgi:hypothetical protein
MADTLREQIVEDATPGGALLPVDDDGNPSDFNQTIYYYPEADGEQKTTVNAIVSENSLEGSREAHGDGIVLNKPHGRAVRESISIWISNTTDITIRKVQPHKHPDCFQVDDEFYVVKRVLGRGIGFKKVICIRTEHASIRNYTRSG